MSDALYRRHEVWKTARTGVTRYLCFEDLVTGRFSVQQADIFVAPPDAAALTAADAFAVELLSEMPPPERSGAFASLSEAISAHDAEFQ